MVLESIFKPSLAEKRPYLVFPLGYLYGILAFFLSTLIFHDDLGMVIVLLTVMFSLPLIFSIVKMEAKKDLSAKSEKTLLKEHRKAILVYLSLFLGFTLAFSSIFIASSPSKITGYFSNQIETIESINGKSIALQGYSIQMKMNSFFNIFLNNFRVTVFCIIFSFIFGAGAIFILSWNGSVLGVALGNFVREKIAGFVAEGQAVGFAHYLHSISHSIVRYFIHGIPEILAYIVAGVAGGIISFAVIRHSLYSKKFESILVDCADLIIISIAILITASAIEVFITPLLY
jgi:uncharacterized membrane protein SpoIIM required for sporulation